MAKQLGTDGLALGILDENGKGDIAPTRQLFTARWKT
jgi:copper homeostasis protein CutC